MMMVAMYRGSCLFHPSFSRGLEGAGDSNMIVLCSLSLQCSHASVSSITRYKTRQETQLQQRLGGRRGLEYDRAVLLIPAMIPHVRQLNHRMQFWQWLGGRRGLEYDRAVLLIPGMIPHMRQLNHRIQFIAAVGRAQATRICSWCAPYPWNATCTLKK
jgi:hypothetical protein